MKLKILLSLIFTSNITFAETQAVLIGGGYKLEASQGQIEENVHWLKGILPNHVKTVDTFFGSGTDETLHDVVYWDETSRQSNQRNPIADVLDTPASEWIRYRHNQINPTLGSTEKNNLVAQLNEIFGKVTANNFLLVYNGHGGYGGLNKTHLNTLLLWNNTHLDVGEFRDLLNKMPKSTNKRFVLTQCFSGGFYDAVLNNNRVSPNSCGFMADAENLEAEGCELGINKDDFRDYTTYFFAALDGKTRYNEPLPLDPDRDGNKKISFHEAHLYALQTANSSDLSRSTSEIFLERWQPWFLRWQKPVDINNEYSMLAKTIADTHSINIDDLTNQRAIKEKELVSIQSQKQSASERIKSIQKTLLNQLSLEFPYLSHPYTTSYSSVISEQEELIKKRITEFEDYSSLVAQLELMEKLMTQELSTKREITQIQKVHRLQHLSVLINSFSRFASDSELADYQSLTACEKGYLD